MGFIYVITNKINNKQYIGKTEDTIENRWKTHRNDMSKKSEEKRPLYSAMRKYGIENFTIEKIEEVNNNSLSDREVFYIESYKTYSYGYNATYGGDGRSKVSQEEKDLYTTKFNELKSVHKVANFFNRDIHTISVVLKDNGVNVNQFREEVLNPQFKTKKIIIVELDLKFDSVASAANYLVENNMTSAKVNSARVSIGRAISGLRKSYLGYTWKEV